jgi:hypothetical protein
MCAHFDHPAVSNGQTQNLKIKNTKRIALGYRNFDHYRLRLLLNHGRIRPKITHRHGPELALPGSLRRAGSDCGHPLPPD